MGPDSARSLRVAVVVPAKKYPGLAGPLWVQRYGPLQVASVAARAGYPVRLFNEELGTGVNVLELAHQYDVAGFSCKTSAMTRAEEIACALKSEASRAGRSVVTVLGGEHISMGGSSRPSKMFDYTLRGEAEEAFVALLNLLASRPGGARNGAQQSLGGHHTCERFDNVPDLSLCPEYMETVRTFMFRRFPLLWMILKKRAPIMTFQGSRGCPYNCSFCPSPSQLQSKVYRRRSLESSVACLREHAGITGIQHVMFEDPTAALPFSAESRLFFKNLADNPTGLKYAVLVRADLCRDVELLEIMKAAGVRNLSVGIESLSDKTLGDFGKRISRDMTRKAIDVFHRHGFTITGLFIAGYDTDEPDCFEEMRTFIRETGIEKWRVTSLSQMPESEGQFMPAHRYFLWDEFKAFGRDAADYFNGEFVMFYPKSMKPSTLQKRMMEFNLSASTFPDLVRLVLKKKSLAVLRQRVLNNFAQNMAAKEIAASRYFEMIREIEGRFYEERDGRAQLKEDSLLRRYRERKGIQGPFNSGGDEIFPAAALVKSY